MYPIQNGVVYRWGWVFVNNINEGKMSLTTSLNLQEKYNSILVKISYRKI